MKIKKRKIKQIFISIVLIGLLASVAYKTYKTYQEDKSAKDLKVAFDTIVKSLELNKKFMEDVCFSFWQSHKIPSDLAVSLCDCEGEKVSKTLPVADIEFIQDNIEQFDFLLYKKDERATEIMDRIKNIRQECVSEVEKKMKENVN